MPSTTKPLFERIDSWLQEIDSVKTASAKSKTATKKTTKKAAPDGMGETSHPVEDVDDNTQEADTGFRYEENAEDVKRDVPASVDETSPDSGGSQDDKQFNIGTEQKATGEHPAVEDDYKSDKDDPGTSHPANADEIGEKYSSMSLKSLLKTAEVKAHEILAEFASGITDEKQPIQKQAQQVQQKIQQQPIHQSAPLHTTNGLDKVASELIEQTIKDADIDADLVGSYIHSYYSSMQKRAEGEEELPPEEMPPEEGGGEADALAALAAGGGGGAMGGGMPPDPAMMGGGMPPEAAMGGGDGAGPPGGMSEEQALQELAMALEELGISPEELAQMAAQEGGGGEMGGGAEMGGGMPPPEAAMPPAEEGAKLASAVKTFKRSGRFKMQEAKTAAQRQTRDQIKGYILELTRNNR